ncbi:MAG: hypothetical protein ABIR19_10380 [Ginsengibacter sp.]
MPGPDTIKLHWYPIGVIKAHDEAKAIATNETQYVSSRWRIGFLSLLLVLFMIIQETIISFLIKDISNNQFIQSLSYNKMRCLWNDPFYITGHLTVHNSTM